MATGRLIPGYGFAIDAEAGDARLVPGWGFLIDTDGTPAAFAFTDANATVSTAATSNTVTISGIDVSVAVTFSTSGGADHQYSKNGGAWTSVSDTTAVDGDTFAVRLTANATAGLTAAITMTAGGVSDTYTVTSTAAPVVVSSAAPAGGWYFPDPKRRRREIAEEAERIIEQVALAEVAEATQEGEKPDADAEAVRALKRQLKAAGIAYKALYREALDEIIVHEARKRRRIREDDEAILMLV